MTECRAFVFVGILKENLAMFSPRNRKFLAVVALLLLAMLACNLPDSSPTATQDPGLVYTVAARTVEAEITQITLEGSPTPTPSTTQPPAAVTKMPPPPTRTSVLPTHTPAPSPTATSIPCDKVEFVDDVTIDDGTEISAGEPFEKIWRLKNVGSCTWTSGYDLVFDGGTRMDAPDAQQLTTGTVAPGYEIDIAVDLVAPDGPGTYRANFKLSNPAGAVFGVGESSNPFWVEIRVPDESGVRLDFLARARDADWGTGKEPVDFAGPGHVEISYGGPDTDEDGFVMIKDRVKMENGKTSARILQTHPKWVNDGYIVGKYPAYRVGPGDYIKGQLGFIALEDGTCGDGDVTFEIHYIKDDDLGTRTRLAKWSKDCDGHLLPIELSLADLIGEDVHFYLVVLADGPSTQDWAIWSSLGVMR
jgi:hypothetical protein